MSVCRYTFFLIMNFRSLGEQARPLTDLKWPESEGRLAGVLPAVG